MASSNVLDIGTAVRITATFTDLLGVPADPVTVVLKLKGPDKTITLPGVTKAGIGVYYVDAQPTMSGQWIYRWEGVGGVQVAEEGAFSVRASAFV